MDENYLSFKDELKNTLCKLKYIANSSDKKGLANNHITKEIEYMFGEIESVIELINYYSLEAEQGILSQKENGRFELLGQELTCGDSLEMYSSEYQEWFIGSVEYGDKYYLKCDDLRNPYLSIGMKARLRTKKLAKK